MPKKVKIYYSGHMFLIALFFAVNACSAPNPKGGTEQLPNHQLFTDLLRSFVDDQGLVDYDGLLRNRGELQLYLQELQNYPPDEATWAESDQIAYWINAYNAFTIELVLNHYPIESIKEIGSTIQIPFVNTPWDVKFIEIGGETYDLNNIEHGILRKKWAEPRIHFAINCASYSCPILRQEAFVADRLNEQLNDQASMFLNDDFRNDIQTDRAQLSKIFQWFSGDFGNKEELTALINRFSSNKIDSQTEISYKPYDWRLNRASN